MQLFSFFDLVPLHDSVLMACYDRPSAWINSASHGSCAWPWKRRRTSAFPPWREPKRSREGVYCTCSGSARPFNAIYLCGAMCGELEASLSACFSRAG